MNKRPLRPTEGAQIVESPLRRRKRTTTFSKRASGADLKFKQRILTRRTSIQMHQGHNLVLEAQQKHAKRTATDVHVPLSDKISMTSFETQSNRRAWT